MALSEPTVFAVGVGAGSWAAHLRSVLPTSTLRGISSELADLEQCAGEVDVCLICTEGIDALVTAASVWGIAPHASIILSGEAIDDETRAAAYEAGVAFVTGAAPTADELRAVVRMAHDQNRAGSPELVRAMCRAMCRLSSIASSASNRSFLDAAVLEIAKLFQADIVSVQLVDDHGALRIVASLGLTHGALKAPSRGGIADSVLQHGEPRIVLRGVPVSTGGTVERKDIAASMCVPIAATSGAAQVRGVVNVARQNSRSIFTARDLEVAGSIARLISDTLGGMEARAIAAEKDRQLQAAERLMMLGEIAAGIAHEVANPLAIARANVDSLIAYLTEASPMLAELETRHPQLSDMLDDLPAVMCETWEGLHRADEVVRQVKSLARAEPEGTRGAPLVLSELVQSTVRFLGSRLPRVRTDLDGRALVNGSTVELSQVLVNLLVNASDACEERRACSDDPSYVPTVTVTVANHGDRVLLSVEDNGIGMSEDTKERAFMPLFTTKAGARGTGLGLSLVRRLIDRHAGAVRVTSTPGRGTCFSVLLPAAECGVEPDLPVPAEDAGALAADERDPSASTDARVVQ